jgi:hypothetical protein
MNKQLIENYKQVDIYREELAPGRCIYRAEIPSKALRYASLPDIRYIGNAATLQQMYIDIDGYLARAGGFDRMIKIIQFNHLSLLTHTFQLDGIGEFIITDYDLCNANVKRFETWTPFEDISNKELYDFVSKVFNIETPRCREDALVYFIKHLKSEVANQHCLTQTMYV